MDKSVSPVFLDKLYVFFPEEQFQDGVALTHFHPLYLHLQFADDGADVFIGIGFLILINMLTALLRLSVKQLRCIAVSKFQFV